MLRLSGYTLKVMGKLDEAPQATMATEEGHATEEQAVFEHSQKTPQDQFETVDRLDKRTIQTR